MRAAVVCRFPIYREALARLVASAFGADHAESFSSLQEALDRTAERPFDLLVAELAAEVEILNDAVRKAAAQRLTFDDDPAAFASVMAKAART